MTMALDATGLPEIIVLGNGCWMWTRAVNSDGYGLWMKRGPDYHRGAHRVTWEIFNGKMPEGLEIDHLCRYRACVNPAHLQTVTHAVNTLIGDSPQAKNARRVTCKNGHPFDRVYVHPGGTRQQRICSRCMRQRARSRWLAKKAAP